MTGRRRWHPCICANISVRDPSFLRVKSLLHHPQSRLSGNFPLRRWFPKSGWMPGCINPEQLEFFGKLNFLKAGIAWNDGISTVSKGYAREIQTPEHGFGLDGFLRQHGPITGIVNGVDYSQWSPGTSTRISPRHFSPGDPPGNATASEPFLREYGLPEDIRPAAAGDRFPLRSQKGFDLLADAASRSAAGGSESGGPGLGRLPEYEIYVPRPCRRHIPHKSGCGSATTNRLSHRIEAGADIFLMPSHYEPCGLNQIYSLRYGTSPGGSRHRRPG